MMASGGARAKSGPPPDPGALRRERASDGGWVDLPAAGRGGEVPEWPLQSPSGRELELWETHWVKPQALMWEALGLEHEVALMVRNLVQAEVPGSPTNRSTLVKQLMEDLGLTTAGLARNRWRIVAQVAEAKKRKSGSARNRLKVVADEPEPA